MLRKFYADVGFMTVISAVTRAKDFIAVPVLAHYAGSELFGAWSQANLLVAFAGPVVFLGLDYGFVRYASGLPEREQARQFTALLSMSGALGTVLVVLVLSLPGAVADALFAGDSTYATVVSVVAALVLISPLRGAFESWYLIRGRARRVAGLRAANSVMGLAVLVGGTGFDVGFVVVLGGLVATDGLTLLWMGVDCTREYGYVRPDYSWFRRGFAHGLPLLPGGMSMLAIHYMDRLIIPRYTPFSDLGVYAFAYSIAQVAVITLTMPFTTIYGQSAYGYYNTGRFSELRELCRHSVGSVLTVTIPTIVALYYVGDVAVAVLGPGEFSKAADLLWLVALGYAAQALAKIYRVNIAFSLGTRRELLLLLIACFTNLVLNLLLIPRFGILGAALATTISLTVGGLYAIVYAHRGFPVPLARRAVARTIGAGMGMAVVMGVAKRLVEACSVATLPGGILVAAAGGGAYAAVHTRAIIRFISARRESSGNNG